MKQEVKQGQTDYTVLILIRDTDGAPKTGLTNASGGIDVCYTRVETDNDVVLTDGAPVALATPLLTDPHLDWGFLQVDATKAPGVYRLDIADGVFSAGAWSAIVTLICTGCDPTSIEFVLVPESPYSGVKATSLTGHTVQTGDSYAIVNHADHGNAKLVRSTTPANALDVNAAGEAGLDLDNTSGTLAAAQFAADCLTAAKIAADVHAEAADAVWDEVLTGASHNAATSAGRRLRQAADVMIVRDETCQAGGGNAEIIFDAAASAVNDFYINDFVVLYDGTGVGQVRHIDSYVGATKTATVNRDWDTNPDATTKFMIRSDSTKHVHGLTTEAKTEIGDATADEEYDNDGTAISLRGAIKLLLAVLSGKSSGGGTATLVFRDINDAKNRVSATVDANGNRTAIGTRDAT